MSTQSLDSKTTTVSTTGNPIASPKEDNGSTPAVVQEKYGVNLADEDTIEPEYIEGHRLAIVMTTLCLSTLLAALDIGIVATAIPAITDEFRRLDDVGWYGGVIFLLVGTTSPVWGKLFKYFPGKIVYLTSVAIFLIGSIVAAAAPTSVAIIVGRALQGVGCSGTLGGSVLMINYIAEPQKRPMLIGIWMGVFMISTIIGPLIGGAFTTEVSWRWCFWINLPVGGPIVAMLWFFLRVPKHIKPVPATWKEIFLQLDLPGFSILLTSLFCFTLALQWGGQTKSWSDGSVIATLVMWLVLTFAFFVTEWFQGDYAMVPLRLLKPRYAWSNALYAWIGNMPNFQTIFYLPIYFQSIHGQSAITSGVNNLPYVAFYALGCIASGALIGKTKLLQPYQFASGLLTTAAAALLYTLDIDSSKARYIGPQVLYGFGIGIGNQVPMTTLQALSKPEDVASITGIILMCNALSGAFFVTAAQSLFANRLLQAFASNAPEMNAMQILATGASEIREVFSGQSLKAVVEAYMIGVKAIFAFSLAGAAVMVLISLAIPFKKLPMDAKATPEGA